MADPCAIQSSLLHPAFPDYPWKMTGRITRVSGQSVMRLIKMFHEKFITKNVSILRSEEIDGDKMVSCIKKTSYPDLENCSS